MAKRKSNQADPAHQQRTDIQSIPISGPAMNAGTRRQALQSRPDYREITPSPTESEVDVEPTQPTENDETNVNGEAPPIVEKIPAVKVQLESKLENRYAFVELPESGPIVLPPLKLTLLKNALKFTIPERFPDIEILKWLKSNEVLPIVKQWKTKCFSGTATRELMRLEFQREQHPWEDSMKKVVLAARTRHFSGFVAPHITLLATHATRIVNDNSTWFDQTFLTLEISETDRVKLAVAVLLSAWQDLEASGDKGFFGVLLDSELAGPHYPGHRAVLDSFYLVDKTLSLEKKKVNMKDCGVQTIERELDKIVLEPRKSVVVSPLTHSPLPEENSSIVSARLDLGRQLNNAVGTTESQDHNRGRRVGPQGAGGAVTENKAMEMPEQAIQPHLMQAMQAMQAQANKSLQKQMQAYAVQAQAMPAQGAPFIADSLATDFQEFRTNMSAQELRDWLVLVSKQPAERQIDLLRRALVDVVLNGTAPPHNSIIALVKQQTNLLRRQEKKLRKLKDGQSRDDRRKSGLSLD